jgi:hypothetical protein
LAAIIEREREFKPRGERRFSQDGARRNLRQFFVRRSGRFSMGDIRTDAHGDEMLGVLEKSVEGDVANMDSLRRRRVGDVRVRPCAYLEGMVDSKGSLISLGKRMRYEKAG